ncbi:MetS family NSS transporter small subunit [Clostridium botulinum]|uniref:MetS family NSS transporter small subunit n=1 Tax=Clostridium botulinum TaxID=1491 RepID=A0A6G4CMH2_CLOBO|nr:MetS family NSS transporter small subunit [Clostridium botulinum]MBY6795659.1 MetS family NSS transporter small subunit [Clostridium botulinum]MBY6799838.1 MetS family NSS transporter small subunit [Clostridium botulinum]MBY6865410.1 MetS family NSS transporter small subunit [Clostridium botulinum]MBY6871898.1 MetS family NSS transporter small subunit [Clostridium botulinum]MBY6889605.1 MetS family NSS transporter small subunit [Clostridium botulinum]
MTLSAMIFFSIGATVLWGGLFATIIISMKKDSYSENSEIQN